MGGSVRDAKLDMRVAKLQGAAPAPVVGAGGHFPSVASARVPCGTSSHAWNIAASGFIDLHLQNLSWSLIPRCYGA